MPTVRRSPEVPHDYPYEELGAVLDANRLRELESLLASASGDRWDLDEDENGLPGIRVHFADGHAEHLRATREDRPAGRHDVELIARGRQDLERLIRCLRGELSLPDGELGAIERRLAAASPDPWTALIEADGGLGGSNVITVSDRDDEPDLYLWRGEAPAPDADFRLAGALRNDLPRLLDAVRASRRS